MHFSPGFVLLIFIFFLPLLFYSWFFVPILSFVPIFFLIFIYFLLIYVFLSWSSFFFILSSFWFSFLSWTFLSPDFHFFLLIFICPRFLPDFYFSLLIFICLSWSLSAETFPCCCHHRQSELRRLTLSCHILICFKQWPPKNHLSIHFLKSSSFLARFNSPSLVWVAASLRKATLRPHRWHDCSERLLTDYFWNVSSNGLPEKR